MKRILLMASLAMGALATNAQDFSFDWALKMGGVDFECGNAVAADTADNVYTAGNFNGTVTFDSINAVTITSYGYNDVFITKHNPQGDCVWAKRIGGTSDDLVRGIAVDHSGNVYITGNFNHTCDFDPSGVVVNITSHGVGDIFVVKLNNAGELVWAKRMGGTGHDLGFGIAVDKDGSVYTVGNYTGTCNFNPGSVANLTSNGLSDIFISKLDKDGNYEWAKSIGGPMEDGATSVVTDEEGNVYFTGSFRDTADFDPAAAVVRLTSSGSNDVFVTKYNSSGLMQWTRQMGGTRDEYSEFITIDKWNNLITTGTYGGNDTDFDPGTDVYNLTGTGRVYVSKLAPNGDFVWAKKIGSAGTIERSKSVAVDILGNIYTVGEFSGTNDFDPGTDVADLIAFDGTDVFISKLDTAGNYVWALSFAGNNNGRGNGIAVATDGSVYTTGCFEETVDFDPGAGTVNMTEKGGADIFVSKLNQCLLNTATTLTGITLVSHQSGVSYQWINCSDSAAISGATNQSFTPDADGRYAVIITKAADCKDTSDCVQVMVSESGIAAAFLAESVHVFPNPAQDQVTVNNLPAGGRIQVAGLWGNVLFQAAITDETMRIDLGNYASGMYFIRISNQDNETAMKKLMISK